MITANIYRTQTWCTKQKPSFSWQISAVMNNANANKQRRSVAAGATHKFTFTLSG